jgi:enoyl-CoA hydratase
MSSSRPVFENLKLEVEGRIATLIVDRPKALNALNEATLRELEKAFHYIESCASARHASEQIDVVIFTGAGEKAFIAGADILEMKDKSKAAGEEFARFGQRVTHQMELLTQPIIAAVNGFALGGGCEFAMACDFIIASENAVFGQPEVALGIMPGFGGCIRLPRYVGLARAKELIYTGRKFKAEEAKAMGLVLDVLPQAALLGNARAIAEQILKVSPLAVARSKRTMDQAIGDGAIEALAKEAQVFGSLFGSHDQREGMQAFAEKRKADFKGE